MLRHILVNVEYSHMRKDDITLKKKSASEEVKEDVEMRDMF